MSLLPASGSTPSRPSSRKQSSSHHTPPVTSQADLQETLSKEIHNHVWKFDAKRIAEMLSATGKGSPDRLVDSAHAKLRESPAWPTNDVELDWYTPLAGFLNNCVNACRLALGKRSGSRFYGGLNFIVYNKSMADGVGGASPVKPDLVSGLGLGSDDRVAWGLGQSGEKQVLIPVEVKSKWNQMVPQAATYSRCLFSAGPSRQFCIVLGFRHTTAELRFLVFHRSGLTGSKPCPVKSPDGQKDILRMFLSILEWKSANDAGFLDFFNDLEMSLLREEGDKTGTVARVTEVLHDGLCVRGRASRVLLMEYPADEGKEPEPGIPILVPIVQTRRGPKTRSQTKQETEQGDSENRMSFHLYCIPVTL
jgi:hypothetical protein